MFTKSRKDKLVEQGRGLAHDISEAVAPAVDRAREELAPRLADARDAVAPRISDARDAVAPRLADARDAVAPRLADARDAVAPRLAEARDAVAPRLAEARDQAAPYVETARERLVKDVVPAVKGAVAEARDQAVPIAEEARKRGAAAAAALKGEPVQKKGGKGKYLLLAALAGAAAFAVKKLKGDESANWQSSYTPTPPAPAPTPAPSSPSAPMAGTHAADVPVDTVEPSADPAAEAADVVGLSDADPEADAAGATPSETISDQAEEPHPVTTPDSPAENVDVSDKPDPKA